ncbi:cytochrome P450 [Gigaspora margarita]|uniref:Cytochrome P450 n=1 Tax=Gigaspora margarita TaxID=4874 RepID=A0A8H4A6G9_GIGMA|nr:cytochrome P450 [Gigaspora margarita]
MLDEHIPNSLIARYYGVNVVHSDGSVWRRYRFTLDVLGKAAFGIDFNSRGIGYKFDKIIEPKLEDLVNGNTESNRKDLLDLMLKACEDPENQNLTNTELRHNLGVFMLAGHDTTASSLVTVLYLLAAHKDVQQKAREEILTVLDDDLTPSAEQHRSLKYLNMIIYENLRLYPQIAILPARVTTKDIECCGNVITTGACIQIFIYGIHHSSKFWKNPEEFLPERFENESEESGSWFGFGGGFRKCLGYMIEQRIVLCLLLRKYEISLTSNSIHKDGLKIDMAYSGTMSPIPVGLLFKRRSE